MRSITALAPSPHSRANSNWREAGFAVYVHWPFCQSKCPYCDFNSHVVTGVDQAAWRAAMVREIQRAAQRTADRDVTSVFFGGGTPSMMEPETVSAILEAISDCWSLPDFAEVTLEANPTSVEAARFLGYRAAGVNRLSVGAQALDDAELRRLGRLHSSDEARAALKTAHSIFPRVSADLIYARQHQTLQAWRNELKEALDLGLAHLSLYQLTIEDGTVFGERHRKGLLPGLPEEELGADLFELTQEVCGAAGLPAYEISNHARSGAESAHNLVYWRAGDWVGIGPGAKGRICDGTRRWEGSAPSVPGEWLSLARGGNGATTWEPADGHGTEYLMMGLRLVEGVSLTKVARLGVVLPTSTLDELSEAGLVDVADNQLRLSAAGRPLLNAVLRELI